MANTYLKNKLETEGNSDTSTYFIDLTRDSFVIDKRYISFKIIDELGKNIAHYTLDTIVSIDLDNNKIIIHTSDGVPITYVFRTIPDAEAANDKLNNFINGSIH
jgi:hypothetical protein